MNDSFAEEEGFEPPVPCGTLDFKSSAFDHSAIPLIKEEVHGLICLYPCFANRKQDLFLNKIEPSEGLEPTTC